MATKKPSLLVVTPRFPYPVVGGDRLRIFSICQVLSEHFDLTLLSLCESRAELRAPLPRDGVFKQVERLHMPRWRSWLHCLAALPTRTPLQVAYYALPRLAERMRALAPAHDGMLLHLIRAADMARDLPGPKFLEMTDAISLTYRRMRGVEAHRRRLASYIYRLEEPRLHAYEREIVHSFDHTFLVSEADRQFLFSNDGAALARVSVVGNGVDGRRLPWRFDEAGRDLVFIGNMETLPNRDAVEFLAADILPRVRRSHPDARLRVIGRIGARERERLARLDHVVVVGEVADVAPAARGGGVGVCAMRMGAGIQNKVLEYMALGLPTVSTAIGLEGLAARPGVEAEAADDAEGFARHVAALLSDRARARAMAVAARRYVEERHGWAAVVEPMVRVISGDLGPAGSSAGVLRAEAGSSPSKQQQNQKI